MPKNILVVAPILPKPANRGNSIRLLAILDSLRQLGFLVDFLYISSNKNNIQKSLNYIGKDNFYFYQTRKTWLKGKFDYVLLKLCLLGLLKPDNIFENSIDYYIEKDLLPFFKNIINRKDYQAVIINYVFYSKLLNFTPDSIHKIIDTHDKFANRWRATYELGKIPRWYAINEEQEVLGLSRSNTVIAIQKEETNYFKSKLKKESTEVVCVPHPVKYTPLLDSRLRENKILYVGASNNFNFEAIKKFIDVCYSILINKKPNIELLIAGSICNLLEDYSEHRNIKLLGVFESSKDIYSKADIVINPVIQGTGLKIKNIEALGYSKYLITTKLGARGLEDWNNRAFLVANNVDDFNEKIMCIFNDISLRNRIQDEIKLFVEDWNRLYEKELKFALKV